jgi:phage/plasmid-associated DNA primase
LDFGKYKHRLLEYLRYKGFEPPRHEGLISCFSPDHDDKNPSCQVSEESFFCHSGKCGINGDIYDAIGILEGITDRAEQYKFAEKLFDGGATVTPAKPKRETEPEEEAESFSRDEAADALLEAYLIKNPAADKMIGQFLKTRAAATASGLTNYPADVLSFVKKHFFYWPGYDIAKQEIDPAILNRCQIPGINPKFNESSWGHSGVIVKIGTGYKLQFYPENISTITDKVKQGIKVSCEKRGTKKCHTFPMPGKIDPAAPVVLVEGEMNAIACAAIGIKNVFATGGTNALTKPKVKAYLLDAKEIILFYDADTSGRKASGIEPLDEDDKRKTNIPGIIKQAGFQGIIKIAELPVPPEGDNGKDQEALVLTGRRDLVLKAVAEAREYIPPIPIKKPGSGGRWEAFDTISLKRLKKILDKIPRDILEEEDIQPFIIACVKSCKMDGVQQELAKWGATPDQIKETEKDEKTTPYFLIEVCEKYEVSKYIQNEIEKALIPASEILRRIKVTKPLVKIDYTKMEANENVLQFFMTLGVHSAAMVIADIMDGRLIYVENEKRHYFFNGHTWQREPDVAEISYSLLCSVILHFYKNKMIKKTKLFDLTNKIEGRRFRVELTHDFSGLHGVHNENILFDGPGVRETLTLIDGVFDFSGGELVYRKSMPEEYRREVLPYKIDDIKHAVKPEKFSEFMKGNFKNEKTLESIQFYISLFASRNTQYKYGGIWVGKPHTGKTTLVELMTRIYPGMLVRLNGDILVTKERRRASGNEATPYVARMEGKGVAIAQETERNGILNNALWKEWTGGDTITARGLYQEPHDFIPTAQILVCTNHQPRFDAHDEATIDRMIVIPFSVQHEKGKKGTIQQTTIYSRLRPEYPAIVKHFAEYYIKFKNELGGLIPLSDECFNYKQGYVKEMETDLDKFVDANIDIDMSGNCFETVQAVYERYLKYFEYQSGDKEALSRNKFVRYLKHDYMEIDYRQKKINGEPVLCFFNVKLKPWEGKTDQPGLPEGKKGAGNKNLDAPPPSLEDMPF